MLAASIQPTMDAIEGEWTVQLTGPPTEACWQEQTKWGGDTEWVKRADGYVQVFAATSSYFDETVDPHVTVQAFAEVWTTLFPKTAFVERTDDYIYGAQTAGLSDSDQLRVIGGFGVDNWQFSIEVSCETPGFRRDDPSQLFGALYQ